MVPIQNVDTFINHKNGLFELLSGVNITHVACSIQESPVVLYVVVLWCNLRNQNVKWWQFSTNVKTHECEC